MLKIEQLQPIMFCMKNQDTLIKQSLQNPIGHIVQSCIPNLEGVIKQINTSTIIQLHIAMNKQAQIISINIDPLALILGQ